MEVSLPGEAMELLLRILAHMADGNVVKLLEEGAIPCRKVATHRRILLRDLLEYHQRDREERAGVADELTAEAERLGLYD